MAQKVKKAAAILLKLVIILAAAVLFCNIHGLLCLEEKAVTVLEFMVLAAMVILSFLSDRNRKDRVRRQ